MLPTIMLRSKGAPKTLAQKVKILFGSNLIACYPLNETAGGTAKDSSGNGFDGSYVGPTLAQAAFPTGGLAPLFDGTNDYVNIQGAGLAAAFNGNEGTIILFYKVLDVGVWADGTSDSMIGFYASDNNRMYLIKSSNTNKLVRTRYANGVGLPAAGGLATVAPSIGWCMFTYVYSDGTDIMKSFCNSEQLETTITGLETWTGAPTRSRIGAGINAGSPDNFFKGYLSHVIVLNRPATNAELLTVYNYVMTSKTIDTLGDSIANGTGKWPNLDQGQLL